MAPAKVRAIIEAVLLTAEDPVPPARFAALLEGLNNRDVRQVIDGLRKEYEEAGRGFTIIEVAGGYQLATREDLGPWLRQFHRERGQVRLSQAALETLAIVAFKQPITRVQVDSIRGVNSGGVVQTLMEVGMVRIVGRSDGIGKPMLFGTTKEFLIHFGLRSLSDLPRPKELEELLQEGEEKARQRGQAAVGQGPGQEAFGVKEAGTWTSQDAAPTQAQAEAGGEDGGAQPHD